jgi:predicted nucleotidyltransferase
MATVQESLDPNFKELFESLNSARVRYLVLGGYAVNYYGYHRATDDLDIWIAVEAENAVRISQVLKSFGGFPDSKVAPSQFLQKGMVFIFGREPLRVDILTGASGIDFESCYSRRLEAVWGGVKVSVISLEDLLANKKASARIKDLADLAGLPSRKQASKRGTNSKNKRKRKS